ncbi:MAG: Unknown protein [uncultured Campylobacterales bacterium]|uniref:Porin domain-containing protein n=1 Tax=uncultured Campylobacterales bacterium TaxID=352960 RepID=A0A6S6SCH4_9BACT|nr:MAG: Unknown protein [uncultured Campylobacterales bacterium]
MKKIIFIFLVTAFSFGAETIWEQNLSKYFNNQSFSGIHYFAFNTVDNNTETTYKFNVRRNYLTFKNKLNDYINFRITYDVYQNDDGDWDNSLKYAYIYFKKVLPYTDLEIGQAHTTWIDYEKKSSWKYDLASRVFLDDRSGANLLASADLGFKLITNLDYFSSAVGVYDGEGQNRNSEGKGLSVEARLTYHILGNSYKKDYLNLSVLGNNNNNNELESSNNSNVYGVHLVYKNDFVILSVQYIDSKVQNEASKDGYSFSGDYSINKNLNLFGMYSSFEDTKTRLAGLSYKINQNINTVAMFKNYSSIDEYHLGLQLKW